MQTADFTTIQEPFPASMYDLDERIPKTPPVIAPVASSIERPLWSVMIPVYNCLEYLTEALTSVLAQDAGEKRMQITVVDDCSTDGDVEELVRAIAGQRVKYFRQTRNRGSLRNFETCLNLAIGHRVHILHGDDRVVPGFYAEIENLFRSYPDAGAAFTNFCHITSSSETVYVNDELLAKPGILKDFLVRNAQQLLVQPPAIVVKRSVYERIGGFYGVHYGEDWEMWTRIAASFSIAYSPMCLANYRYYTNNSITKQSIISGQNVHDIIQIVDTMQAYLPPSERANTKKIARRQYAIYCINQAYSLYQTNRTAAWVQVKGALLLSNDAKIYVLIAKYLMSNLIRYSKIKKVIKSLRLINSH